MTNTVLAQSFELLKLVKEIVGLKKNIKIDSGVHKHYIFEEIENLLDKSNDTIVIVGSQDKPISIDDILNAFERINEQLSGEIVDNFLSDKGLTFYFYHIMYNNTANVYQFVWNFRSTA